jgi:hypothetical protein
MVRGALSLLFPYCSSKVAADLLQFQFSWLVLDENVESINLDVAEIAILGMDGVLSTVSMLHLK